MNSQRLKQHTRGLHRSEPHGSYRWKNKWTHAQISTPETISNGYPLECQGFFLNLIVIFNLFVFSLPFYYRGTLGMYYSSQFFGFMGLLSVQRNAPLCLCFLFLSLSYYPSLCFFSPSLMCKFLFGFILCNYPLEAYFFPNKKEMEQIWMGGGLGRNRERKERST